MPVSACSVESCWPSVRNNSQLFPGARRAAPAAPALPVRAGTARSPRKAGGAERSGAGRGAGGAVPAADAPHSPPLTSVGSRQGSVNLGARSAGFA